MGQLTFPVGAKLKGKCSCWEHLVWPWRCGVQVLSHLVVWMDVNTDFLRESVVLWLLTGWHSPLFSTLPAKGTEGKPFSFMKETQGTYCLLGRVNTVMEWILFREVQLDCHAGQIALAYKKKQECRKLPTPSAHIFLSNVLKHRSG